MLVVVLVLDPALLGDVGRIRLDRLRPVVTGRLVDPDFLEVGPAQLRHVLGISHNYQTRALPRAQQRLQLVPFAAADGMARRAAQRVAAAISRSRPSANS